MTSLSDDNSPENQHEVWSGKTGRIAALLIFVAAFLLWLPQIVRPNLLFDDFRTITKSWPLPVLKEKLWEPHNEHVMPLTRILTYGLAELAGSASALPAVFILLGPITLLLTMGALYFFVRRELGHPFYGLFAMLLFGITSQYAQSVRWYAAVYFLMCLLFTLLGLLGAQRWSLHGSWLGLVVCVIVVAMTPAWSAVGLLAGPICSLYLWIPDQKQKHAFSFWKRTLIACIPTLGTILFLVVARAVRADVLDQINSTAHYGKKTATDSFAPLRGMEYTLRSLIDNLIFGTVDLLQGINSIPETWRKPWERRLTFLALIPLFLGGIWWFRRAPRKRLLILGLGFIFCNYFLIYGARSEGWRYERIRMWGRYQVFPHCGLVLFLVGALPHWKEKLLYGNKKSARRLRRIGLISLILIFAIHFPHTWPWHYQSKQIEQLQAISAVDKLCQQHRIGRDQAIKALPRFDDELVYSAQDRFNSDNGWDLLRGSDNPIDRSPDEIRQLLKPAIPPEVLQKR